METKQDLGSTILATIRQVENKTCLKTLEKLKSVLEQVATDNELDVKAKSGHQFEPEGASMVFILGSSHLCVHTWPEYSSMTVDIHMCSECGLTQALAVCESIKNATKGIIGTQNVIHH